MAQQRKKPPRRKRHQLMCSLGTGDEALQIRAQFEAAARREGKRSLSAWMLSVLMEAAKAPARVEPVTRAELEALVKRVAWLEVQPRL